MTLGSQGNMKKGYASSEMHVERQKKSGIEQVIFGQHRDGPSIFSWANAAQKDCPESKHSWEMVW